MSLSYFVYLVKCGSSYKVGYAKNVKARLSSMQTGSPENICLIDSFESFQPRADEAEIHAFLAPFRIRGEWFNIPSYVIDSRSEWFFPSVLKISEDINSMELPLVKVLADAYENGNAEIAVALAEFALQYLDEEAYEKFVRKIMVYSIEQETSELAAQSGVAPAIIHDARYLGLYGKNAKQLSLECGASERETPLDYMSGRDLSLNSLSNQAALESGDMDRVGLAAQLFRHAFEQSMGKVLSPNWQASCVYLPKQRDVPSGEQMKSRFESLLG